MPDRRLAKCREIYLPDIQGARPIGYDSYIAEGVKLLTEHVDRQVSEPGISIRYLRHYDIAPDPKPLTICQCGATFTDRGLFYAHSCNVLSVAAGDA